MRPCRPYTLWACHRQSISTDRLAHNVQCCADLIRELVMVREGLLVLSDSRISKDYVCAAIEHLCVECMIATVLWLLLCFFVFILIMYLVYDDNNNNDNNPFSSNDAVHVYILWSLFACHRQSLMSRHQNSSSKTTTNSIDVVKACQSFAGSEVPSCLLKRKTNNFILRFNCVGNTFCNFCSSINFNVSVEHLIFSS